MQKTFKSMAGSVLIATLLFAQMPVAQAKLGSGSSSASSPSRASSPPSRPAPSYSPPSSNRVGGGNSVGMARPSVMESVRKQPAPPPAAPVTPRQAVAPAAKPTYAPQTPAPSQQAAPSRNSGIDWKSAAIGAAGGAAVTYALTRDGSPTQPAPAYPQNGVSPVSPYPETTPAPPYQPAIAALPAPTSSSGLGAFGTLLMFALVAVAGFFAWRALNTPKSGRDYAGFTNITPKKAAPELNFDPKEFFIELQAFNSSGDAQSLKRVMTAELFKSIEETIGAAPTEVLTLSAQTLSEEETNAELLSVQYTGTVRENGVEEIALNEVWHFIKVGDKWLLAGIEQV